MLVWVFENVYWNVLIVEFEKKKLKENKNIMYNCLIVDYLYILKVL